MAAILRRAALLLTAALLATASTAGAQPIDEDEMFDQDDDLDAPTAQPPQLSVGVSVGGMYLTDVDALNRAVGLRGMGVLSAAPVVIEPSVALYLDRVVVPVRARLAASGGDGSLELSSTGALAGIGYTLKPLDGLVLYPTLSFGILRTQLTAGRPILLEESVDFSEALVAAGPLQMSRITVVSEAAFAGEWRFIRAGEGARGLYLGARVGITAAIADAGWTVDHTTTRIVAEDGPQAPVSGPLAALSLAFRM